ncbi:VOC family protein [Actinokineospora bangkokensis]|uniref:Biphenyl 2,3-dioxygenase n=1 Tax=Actinokineospora bangkokensis TaxID=1193682 RepID=A0A1Q9LQV5_9PSEU|nr:VOC family protein [Actinokineospora bangkokensis]OLR94426.1 biphenyl 2,3-dioxygenase [Actinokineospora bangkokensis]
MEAAREAGTGRPANGAAPDFLAHWVVKTARRDEMIAWYREVFGARVVHRDRQVTFLSWDHEHHRLALIAVPRVLRYLFPLARLRRKVLGIDHLAVQFASLERLLTTHERLAGAGIHPVWAINHGPTTSLYYEDPDGIRLEFQVDNFPTVEATAAHFAGEQFAANPIGVEFDPAYLLDRLRRGDDPTELLRPGAGTRPGTTPRSGRRAITWRTL